MTTHEMIDILEGIIRDESTNATARCTAIRTLMRIEDHGGSRELDEEASGFAELDAFAPRRRPTDRRRSS
ncbi:MAG: hypothetical protein K0R88_1172 [Solirubrobacterales bacterium]|jgi:hypothetical protein|nr:hypothetical protein [Solirubrobacterales bacterium]